MHAIWQLDELQEKEGIKLVNSLTTYVYYKNKIINVKQVGSTVFKYSGVADALDFLENNNVEQFKGCAATG